MDSQLVPQFCLFGHTKWESNASLFLMLALHDGSQALLLFSFPSAERNADQPAEGDHRHPGPTDSLQSLECKSSAAMDGVFLVLYLFLLFVCFVFLPQCKEMDDLNYIIYYMISKY